MVSKRIPTTFEKLRRTPLRYAAFIASLYLVVGLAYIHLSDYVALQFAMTAEALSRVEVFKGTAFIVVTAVLLFVLAHRLFRRAERSAENIVHHREALLSAERRAMAGMVGMSMVHDFNNLLQSASGNAELLQMDLEEAPDDIRQPLAAIKESLERMQNIAARIQSAGRRSTNVERSTVNLSGFMRDCLLLVQRHDKVRTRHLTITEEAGVEVNVMPHLVQDAVLNLVINAAEAAGPEGRIDVRISATDRAGVVEVHDSGPGVAEDERRRIFEPYYTSKDDGTGLGLLSVRTCAQAHGGSYDVRTSPLGGACFRLELPRPDAARDVA